MARHLLIRADANAKIGTGHVMRCLALAQAWQDAGGTVSLAARKLPEGLRQRLESEHVEIVPLPELNEAEDAAQLVSLAKDGAQCVVVDGYQFGIVHQRALRDAGIRQLFIDDYGHAPEYVADFVLNQNITAEESLYRNRAPHTKLLLGTKYVLLRREFRSRGRSGSRMPHKPARVLVSFGGSDPIGLTPIAISALSTLKPSEAEIKVLAGSAYEDTAKLEKMSEEAPAVALLRHVVDMPALIDWADVAVSAAGSTVWELAYFGIPALLVVTAANQSPTADKLHKLGLASILDRAEIENGRTAEAILKVTSNKLYQELCASLQTLVDGEGGPRVTLALQGE